MFSKIQLSYCFLILSINAYAIKPRVDKPNIYNNTSDEQFSLHDAQRANDASSLREGIIENINTKTNIIKIKDQYFEVDLAHIRIFYNGRLVPFSHVLQGSKIKFLLKPTLKQPTISVIYLN